MSDTAWRGRFLAEFALIVVGVLVALALEAWWSGRQDRRDEAEYIADLHNEAERNLETVQLLDGYRATAEAALRRAARLLDAGHQVDSAQVFVLNLAVGSSFADVPSIADDAVFEDLQSSGRLQLIRDDDLRRGIIEHYRLLGVHRLRLAQANEEFGSQLAAVLVRHLPPGLVARVVGGDPSLRTPGPTHSPEQFATSALSLADEPLLHGEIRAELETLAEEGFIMERVQRTLDRHLERLSAAASTS